MARRRQSVTIKHVAADAGVSLQTVSRVINDGPNVRPAMRERVQASIDRLGYVPSIAAQRMSGSRSYLILVLNDRERTISEWEARLGSDWIGQMLLGGMLRSAELGCRMLIELVDTHSDHVERELSAALSSLQPDGVILTPPHSENLQITNLLSAAGIRFARIGSRDPGDGLAITMGDQRSAVLATEHLLELGHERIGFIEGPEEYSLARRRTQGWRETMSAAGLSCDDLCEQGDFGFESGLVAARKLLARDPRPTAIIASSDQMALAVLEAAGELDLTVPDALSLISFDNSPITRFTRPQLTAIDQPIAETFRCAVELLIKSDGTHNADPVTIYGELIVRDSTAPAPVADA